MNPESFAQRIHQTRRTIQIIWRSGPIWLILDCALVIFQSLPPIILIFLAKVLLDKVTVELAKPDVNTDQLFTSAVPIIVGILFTMLLISAVRGLSSFVTTAQTQRVTSYVTDLIQTQSLALDLEFYENPQYQDLLHLTQQEAPTRLTSIVTNLIDLGQGIVSGITILGLLIAFNPYVVLILVAAVVPGIVLRFYLSRKSFRWRKQRMNYIRWLFYLNNLLITIASVKEIKLYDVGPQIVKRFQKMRDVMNHEVLRQSTLSLLVEFAIQASAVIAVIGIYAYIVYMTIQRRITIGDMVMYYQLFQRAQIVLQDNVNSLTRFYDNSLYASAVFDFMDLKNRMPRAAASVVKPFPKPIREGIRFENVSFQYQGSSNPTFENINITLGASEVIALVGANGAGKTTLIKLLCRLYDPTEGRITVDGIDLRDFAIEEVRSNIGVIFQDYLSYQLSAADNIWFGNVNMASDLAKIQAKAEIAEIHDKLSGLKNGYNTHLGRALEDGEELSGGQWQKVALARLFFRDAPIVVLDEPTSAMDARAEYSLFLKFRDVIRGKSAILISHRLSTVRMADRIYVLENGRIIENGTHEELMANDESYATLFKMQAHYYEVDSSLGH